VTSSVDPTVEIAAIIAKLETLAAPVFEGIEQGTVLPTDGFGKAPYRDVQPGSVIPAAKGRQLGVGEQSQPHIWAFQVSHFARTRKLSSALAIETDKTLIGWSPSSNAGTITTFYFTVYDEFSKNGERVATITTRFYEVELGLNPDLS